MVSKLTRKQAKAEVDIIIVNLGTLMVISGSFSTVMRQMEMSVESGVFSGASTHKAANSRLGRVLAPEGERVISRGRVVHVQKRESKGADQGYDQRCRTRQLSLHGTKWLEVGGTGRM